MVFCFTSFAIAGPGNGSTANQDTDVTNVQSQWILGNGASNATFYSDAGIGLPITAVPYHLQIGPGKNQIVLWNGIGFHTNLYQGTYTRKTVNYNLAHVGKNILDTSKWFVGCGGWGFKFGDNRMGNIIYPKTDKIKLLSNLSLNQIEDNYYIIYCIDIGARKDITFTTALNFGLRAGMNRGGTHTIFSGDMNTVYNASTVGLGLGQGHANKSNSTTATLGVNLSDTKGQGEAALHLLVLFEKTNKEKAASRVARTILVKNARETQIEMAVQKVLFEEEVKRRIEKALADRKQVKVLGPVSENAVVETKVTNGGPKKTLDPTEHTRKK